MNGWMVILAAATDAVPLDLNPPPAGKEASLSIADFRIILLVVGLLALVLVLWALYLRKRKKQRHHSHHHRHHQSSPTVPVAELSETTEAATAENAGEDQTHHHHRRKLHRRLHRPRNPTLSETGGLPPVREDDSASSGP